jgi:hypothetical protein
MRLMGRVMVLYTIGSRLFWMAWIQNLLQVATLALEVAKNYSIVLASACSLREWLLFVDCRAESRKMKILLCLFAESLGFPSLYELEETRLRTQTESAAILKMGLGSHIADRSRA